MFLIWLSALIPTTIWAQVNTLFVKQGTTLDRSLLLPGGHHHFQIPAASLASFITLSMLLSLPLYDRVFVPFMRSRTGNPRGITLLQRLGIGFAFLTIVAMVACFVELKRLHTITTHNLSSPNDIIPMSIFWLLPQYVLLGIGDVFIAIGMLEFFYDQSPEDMQSLGTTFFTSGIGVGNFLNSLLVTVVDKLTRRRGGRSWIGNNLNESHLDYYYGFLMVMSAVNLVGFVWVSRWYVYKEEVLEVGEEGKVVVVSSGGGGGRIQMEGRGIDSPSLGLQV